MKRYPNNTPTLIKNVIYTLATIAMLTGLSQAATPRSPTDLAISTDRKTLYVAELTGSSIAAVDAVGAFLDAITVVGKIFAFFDLAKNLSFSDKLIGQPYRND